MFQRKAEIIKNFLIVPALWSRRESNLHQKFRKLLFYPLNYETNKIICEIRINTLLLQAVGVHAVMFFCHLFNYRLL
jgi:hypothetical protein